MYRYVFQYIRIIFCVSVMFASYLKVNASGVPEFVHCCYNWHFVCYTVQFFVLWMPDASHQSHLEISILVICSPLIDSVLHDLLLSQMLCRFSQEASMQCMWLCCCCRSYGSFLSLGQKLPVCRGLQSWAQSTSSTSSVSFHANVYHRLSGLYLLFINEPFLYDHVHKWTVHWWTCS